MGNRLGLCLATLLLLGGSAWHAHAQQPCGCDEAMVIDLTGKWKGEWRSVKSGHHGPLKAHIRPAGPDHYKAIFHGRFAKIIPFRYSMKLSIVHQDACQVQLAGSRRLPLFGKFEFHALCTASNFDATYSAKNDHGKFTLSR